MVTGAVGVLDPEPDFGRKVRCCSATAFSCLENLYMQIIRHILVAESAEKIITAMPRSNCVFVTVILPYVVPCSGVAIRYSYLAPTAMRWRMPRIRRQKVQKSSTVIAAAMSPGSFLVVPTRRRPYAMMPRAQEAPANSIVLSVANVTNPENDRTRSNKPNIAIPVFRLKPKQHLVTILNSCRQRQLYKCMVKSVKTYIKISVLYRNISLIYTGHKILNKE